VFFTNKPYYNATESLLVKKIKGKEIPSPLLVFPAIYEKIDFLSTTDNKCAKCQFSDKIAFVSPPHP